jgi:ABC-type transport system involved in multi-copper enzyme maturation permease subunit
MRWGPGPVFVYECLTISRRAQFYWARSIGVSALLLAMAFIGGEDLTFIGATPTQEYAMLGEHYFYSLIGVELALVMLAAPAATAGAICLDRSRGALHHLLVTDLSDHEIVIGKLAARLLPVLGLVGCTWPVLAMTSLLGGIDPLALTMAFGVMIAVAILGCALALTLSVWARRPHEVVLVTYSFWLVLLLVWPIGIGLSDFGLVAPPPSWIPFTNPFYLALAPYIDPGGIGFGEYVIFFAAILMASGLLTTLAVRRMRPVACRSNGERRKERMLGPLGRVLRLLPGPSLDGNPVLWREWYRSRPSPWILGLLIIVGGTTSIACVFGAVCIWFYGVSPSEQNTQVTAGIFGYLIQLLFGLLILSALAPTSMSDERQRGSLDMLASTPLSTATIVLGKWWGTFRSVPLLTFGPALMAVALATGPSVTGGPAQMSLGNRTFAVAMLVYAILAHGALLTSIGLALAIWIKHQTRAIAVSVAVFILLSVAWPTLVSDILFNSERGGLALVSPLYIAGDFADALSIRYEHFVGDIWWAAFWNVETTAWAVGLLWLCVRTFDRCFGRMHDRRAPSRLLLDILMIWAATIVIACCAGGALAFWPHGIASSVGPPAIHTDGEWGLLCILIINYLALSIIAPILMREESGHADVDPLDALWTRRSGVVRVWRRCVRLSILLATGPGILALLLSLGVERERLEMSAPNVPLLMRVFIGSTRWHAAVFILTLLVHGALMMSVGLVLSLWIRRLGSAIAASCCASLIVTVAWPLFVLACLPPSSGENLVLLSPIGVEFEFFDSLISPARHVPIAWWVTLCDILIAFVAMKILVAGIRLHARNLQNARFDAQHRDVFPAGEEKAPERQASG